MITLQDLLAAFDADTLLADADRGQRVVTFPVWATRPPNKAPIRDVDAVVLPLRAA